MPQSTHTEPVKAPFQFIWDLLINKMYDPRDHVPGVTDVHILEDDRANGRMLRKMFLNNPMVGDMAIVEEITWDLAERILTLTIVEHPSHTGIIINHVEVVSEGECLLTYKMDWKFKGEGEDPLAALHVKPAVLNSVKVIEAAAAKAA